MRFTARRLRFAAPLLALACAAGAAPAAQAEGVAYLDGAEVWVSSLDGTQKLRLSAGEGNWETVAQSPDGHVVATRREDRAKVFQTGLFTIWRPDGSVKDVGPLSGKTAGDSREVLPLSIALPSGGGLVIYGYANYSSGADLGYFVMPSDARVRPIGGWAAVGSVHYPTLVGERVIGTPDDHSVAVQNAGGGPASDQFTAWPGLTVPGPSIEFVEVADSGKTVALGVDFRAGAPGGAQHRIIVWPTPGLGLAPVVLPGATIPGDTGDCFLPASGDASNPSFSLDGSRLAWADAGGVRITGTPLVQPTVPPENLCTPSGGTITISATGKAPSIGGIDVAAIFAARNPPPPSGGTPNAGSGTPAPGTGGATTLTGVGGAGSTPAAATFPKLKSLKLSSLGGKAGASVEVLPNFSGKATFALTVDPKSIGKSGKKPVTIATGTSTVTAGTTSKVKLKANAAGKKAAKKLKKKKATLTIRLGGATATIVVTLK